MGNLYLGLSKVKNVYIDTSKTKKIYIDTTMVWQSAIPIARPTSAQLNPSATYTSGTISNGFSMTGVEYVRGNVSGTNVGSYVAYYRPDEEHIWEDTEDRAEVAVTLTINAKSISGATITLSGSHTYSGSSQTQDVASVVIGGLSATFSVSGNTGTNAGTYTLTCTGTGNFTGTQTASWTINKATGYVTVAPTSTNATATTYQDVAICNAGSGTGTMYYSKDGSNYSTSIPTQNGGGGNITIYYYAEASTNYTRSAVGSVSCYLYPDYLCCTANTAGSTIALNLAYRATPTLGQNFQTSTDGSIWTTYNSGTVITLTDVGDKVYFKGNNPNGVCEDDQIYYYFEMDGSVAASGNIMSLIDNGACTTLTIPNSHCFYDLFSDCSVLTTAPELPATTLTECCYGYMFLNCTSLTDAPALPATTLAIYCYGDMFYGCTSLTTAPALPATTLEWSCYRDMFRGCTSLTIAPALPATTLADYCYADMFCNCTSLIVSDSSGTGYDKVWTLPGFGQFTSTYSQDSMFTNCAGGSGRSSDAMAGAAGASYTYYTQNAPVGAVIGVKPTVTSISKTYTGSVITNGYTCPEHVSMTGNDSGTNVGTYAATYTPNSGYMWSDGTTGSVTVVLIISDYLCFITNTAGSTISMSVTGTPIGQNFSTSTDGINWTTFTPGTTTITLTNMGDKVYFKGNNPNGINDTWSDYYQFVMTGSISASGNIMSLIDNGACNTLTIPNNYCFSYLFRGCSSLTTAPKLPATTLANRCYYYMFYGCSSLTTAPALPATTLAAECYYDMFCGCTSLTTAPELPATTLANSCYFCMFNGCSSLTTAPELPATTLTQECYGGMFYNCTSLTTVPALPATTLANNCYYQMFYSCTSLITAPLLPATTLEDGCYYGMFDGCTSLTTAPALPATTLTSYCYAWMFSCCSSLTTAPALPATTLADYCYYYMFYGCSSLTTAPALPATTLADSCYRSMFWNCTSLIVSATSGSGYDKEWTIPTSGTFTNTKSQRSMFINCPTGSGRSSDNMAGAAGASYTYYTQNTPVS